MAWGSKQTATQLTGINATEQFFDVTPSLLATDSVHIQIESTGTPGGTDGLDIKVYSTLDDATEKWDTVPITSMQLSDDSDGESVSIVLSGIYKFRVGVASSGATDTHVADLACRIATP